MTDRRADARGRNYAGGGDRCGRFAASAAARSPEIGRSRSLRDLGGEIGLVSWIGAWFIVDAVVVVHVLAHSPEQRQRDVIASVSEQLTDVV